VYALPINGDEYEIWVSTQKCKDENVEDASKLILKIESNFIKRTYEEVINSLMKSM
jgi:Na+-translocating ferredoxin:NAD+ oxidoreductase RnfC subunit